MAKSYGYMAAIQVDTSELTAADSKIRSFNAELKQIANTTKNSESFEMLTQKNAVLGDEIKSVSEKLQTLKNAEEQIQQQVQSGNISAEQYRDYQREVANTEAQLQRLQTQQAQTQKALENYSDSAGKAASKTKSYETALSDLKNSAGKVKSDLQEIVTVAAAAVTAIGAAAAAVVKEVTDAGQSFEAAMSSVKAISGASSEDLERLQAAAEEMGATTSKTATESANALQYMALAGWNTEEMLEGLEPILRASEAGNMDLATCSDLVTDSMSAMGISTESLTDYLNVLTAAQSNANTSLQGILEAYIECGGSMRSFGVSVEESATLLGTLANRGIKASEAGNSLNSLMVNLIGGSSKASTALDNLGMSAWDEEGNFKGLTETLLELNDKLYGYTDGVRNCTDEQAALFESAIGGKTQLTTLQALLSGVTEEYDELYSSLSNADGALIDTAKTMQDNLTGDLTAMLSALEGLEIAAYDYVQEPFREAAQAVTSSLREVTSSIQDGELSGSMDKLRENTTALLNSLVNLVSDDVLPAAIEGMSDVIELLAWIAEHGEEVAAIVTGIATGFAAWKVTKLSADVVVLVKNLISFQAAAATATAEQKALNLAMSANIIAAEVTAFIALVAALTQYKLAADKAAEQAKIAKRAFDDTTVALTEQATAARQAKKELSDTFDGIDENAAQCQALWKELQSLVDAEGNVGENGEKVNSVITQLNELAGTNISIVNGQVQAYSELCDTMDDYIEKMRLEAKLDALKEGYGEALTNVDEQKAAIQSSGVALSQAKKNYENAQAWYNDYLSLNKSATEGAAETLAFIEKYNTAKGETVVDTSDAYVNILGTDYVDSGRYTKVIEAFNAIIEDEKTKAQTAYAEANAQYEAASGIYLDYQDTIKQYEDLALQAAEYSDDAAAETASEIAVNTAENVAEETEAALEETETALENIVKSAWERISNEYTRNGNEYTEEMLAEMEAVLETIGDKESDLYDTYYTKYVSAQAAYQKQIDDLRDDEISDWEDYAEDLVDEIEKSADEVQSAIEKSKSDYLKSGTELGETITDTEGNERFILNDMNAESKALEKYRADMDKLKATGVSEAVISSVYDFDYDSGDRQKYIDELLGMTDEDRERYDKEYQNYLAEVQKTAEYDNQGSINALEAASDTALETLDKATEYYEVGYSMAQEYYKGMADALNEVGIYDTAGIMGRSDVYTQGETGTAGGAAGNYISTDTVISISVAGSEVIRGTIDDYLRGNLISGGNNTYI